MEKKKVRATRTNGRKDSNGVFKAGHNDRSFNLENAEYVDADRSKWNVYWDYLQGYNLADENGVRPERKYLFDEVEYLYYHKQFGDSIDAQNERHEKSRHTERIRNVRHLYIEIAEKYGVIIEKDPLTGKKHLEKNDFIIARQEKEIENQKNKLW